MQQIQIEPYSVDSVSLSAESLLIKILQEIKIWQLLIKIPVQLDDCKNSLAFSSI